MSQLVETKPFDYSDVGSKSDRAWLETHTANVHFLAKKTATTVLQLCLSIKEVHDRLPLHFTHWIESKTTFSVGTGYKMIRVAEAFHLSSPQIERFDPTALYILSHHSVRENVRSMACDLAKDGERITSGRAREIMACFRTSKSDGVTKADVKRYHDERAQADKVFGAERPKPTVQSTDYSALALDGLRQLVESSSRVQFERMEDTETPDDPQASPWIMTCYPKVPSEGSLPKGSHRPKTHTSSDSLMTLILGAAGIQPTRVCSNPNCQDAGREKPLFDGFSRKDGNADGRASACRKCEVKRVTAAKWKKAGRTAPTVPPSAILETDDEPHDPLATSVAVERCPLNRKLWETAEVPIATTK